MNRYEVIGYPLLFISALELLLGFILLRQNPRNSRVNKSVAMLAFFSSAFALNTAIMYICASLGLDYNLFARANWVGWFTIPAALQFIFSLNDKKRRAATLAGYALYLFWFFMLCLSLFTDLIVTERYSLIPYVNRPGPLDNPARMLAVLMILWVMYEIARLRKRVSGVKKAQLNYFFYGMLIFAGGGALTAGFLQLFGGFGFEPGLGSYFGLPWVLLTFYAIARYSLFDVRIIVSRTLSIVLLVVIFTGIQTGMLKLLEPALGTVFAVLISLATIGFFIVPMSKTIQVWINTIIVGDRYRYQQLLKESMKAIVTILNLDELLKYIIDNVRRGLGVENACLYFKDADGRYPIRIGFGAYKTMEHKRALADIALQWLVRTGRTINREELNAVVPEEGLGNLTTYLRGIHAELIIPLVYKGQLQGALAVGRKSSGEQYIQSDIDLLETMAGQAAVAIENARLIEVAMRAKESLSESEGKFHALTQTIPTAVLIQQGEKIVYSNAAGLTMTGYAREELLSMSLWDIVHPAYRTVVQEQGITPMHGDRQPLPHEFKIVKKSGEESWVIMTAGLIEYAGRPAVIGALLDISENKKIEGRLRYVQKMEAIGRLAAGVAHDFNNILSGIVGYGSILHSSLEKGNPLRPQVDQILASSERAANLIRSLLAFGTKQEIRLTPQDINAVVNTMEKFLGGLLRPDIEMKILPSSEPLPVLADTGRLERVIMNFVVNARDAMPFGGQLTIETGRMEQDADFIRQHGYGKLGTYAVLSVRDTGMGMDEQTKKRIFEPFFTTKKSGKGTGFGLSIVYDIVKEHRGYVTVLSGPGKGTTFSVYLPITEESLDAGEAYPAAAAVGGQETILIADDDEVARRYISGALEEFGYRVIETKDGEEAVNLFETRKDQIRLVVLDITMPNMNGREACKAIKKLRPEIKVLFMSGYGEDLLRKTEILDQGQHFILKPVSQKDLLEKVREVLDAQR